MWVSLFLLAMRGGLLQSASIYVSIHSSVGTPIWEEDGCCLSVGPHLTYLGRSRLSNRSITIKHQPPSFSDCHYPTSMKEPINMTSVTGTTRQAWKKLPCLTSVNATLWRWIALPDQRDWLNLSPLPVYNDSTSLPSLNTLSSQTLPLRVWSPNGALYITRY